MRIGILGTGLLPITLNNKTIGAIETVILKLAESFMSTGNKVFIIDIPCEDRQLPNGVILYEVNVNKKNNDIIKLLLFSIKSSQIIKDITRKNLIDVLHIHMGPLYILPKLVTNIPIIFTSHNKKWHAPRSSLSLIDKLQMHSEIFASKNASAVTALTNSHKEVILKKIIKKEKKIFLIPNGVDSNMFAPTEHIEQDCYIITSIGRIEPLKNQIAIIKALPKIKHAVDKKVLVELIGPIDDKEYAKLLIDEAEKNDCKDMVKLVGHVNLSEIPKLINRATIVVHPSIAEMAPLAVLESMACGKLVIANDIPQINSIIINNKNGFIVNVNHSDLLADLIIKSLFNRELKNRIGITAREYVITHYSWQRIAMQLREIYSNLLAR